METYRDRGAKPDKSRDAREVRGKNVLARSGAVLGKVKEVRLSEDAQRLVALVVSRGIFAKPFYITTEYIHRISPKAVLLEIDPSFLHRGRPVVTKDGKRFGKVTDVHRVKETNELVMLQVRRRLRTLEIPADDIKGFGRSIILKHDYDDAKARYTPQRA